MTVILLLGPGPTVVLAVTVMLYSLNSSRPLKMTMVSEVLVDPLSMAD
jgi:hypothetical protein